MIIDELIAFIEARLAEDESIAQGALHSDAVEPGVWVTESHNSEYNEQPDRCHIAEDRRGHYWSVASDVYIPNAEHMARHDPARVLRQCEAQRGVISLYRAMLASAAQGRGSRSSAAATFAVADALRSLADTWSDHPDYDTASSA